MQNSNSSAGTAADSSTQPIVNSSADIEANPMLAAGTSSKAMILVKENDVYKRERVVQFTNNETITFKQPEPKVYNKHESDWYMQVALEKSDLVKEERHLLTYELLVSYRWAIREGYNHQLDTALRNSYDYPRNRNNVKGIRSYIERIKKASDAEMEAVRSACR
ncbi:MAG: hypothetical protein EO766_14465 [Hydrotalea sp. AMD]|uniref:hypothetical protein n=1 Tax=Hydrotalea sp. AMD TaxID=2501297 RepID=UPI001025928F|nr:hypothetical protein [Hydrotalea sp. AMD]RWZ86298.1 MAG: hypothetical protein EO766_14465 [Hydrotalea sp. AMD]